VGGTRNGLTSNALGKRLSATSVATDRGAASFVVKLFKWKFSTLALQTAHCISFSPTMFKALNVVPLSINSKTMEEKNPPSETGRAQGVGAGF
jgi:hypothetical protein